MFIKPAEGRTVYHERTRIRLAAEGEEVPEPLSFHWHRRLTDGDVEVVPPPAEAKAEDPAPPAHAAQEA